MHTHTVILRFIPCIQHTIFVKYMYFIYLKQLCDLVNFLAAADMIGMILQHICCYFGTGKINLPQFFLQFLHICIVFYQNLFNLIDFDVAFFLHRIFSTFHMQYCIDEKNRKQYHCNYKHQIFTQQTLHKATLLFCL